MLRALLEVSLPRRTLAAVTAALDGLGPGLRARAEEVEEGGGCGGLARGGEAEWTACRILLEADSPAPPRLEEALTAVKGLLCAAAREGGLELLQVPVMAQIGEDYLRLRDLLELPRYASRG